jgi:hypothetical protein
VSLYRQSPIQLAIAQDYDWQRGFFDQTGFCHCSRIHLGAFRKDLQSAEIDRAIMDLPPIEKTPSVGQASNQRQLAAFKVRPLASTRASVLALCSSSSRLALAGRDAATFAFPHLFSPWGWLQFVKFHSSNSSTRTRWLIFRTIPRITGVSLCSTV